MASVALNEKANLMGKSRQELCALAVSLGENSYRGAQLYHALYAEKNFNVAAMTNLPAAFRERLGEQSRIVLPEIVRRYDSADGTIRYVLRLEQGEFRADSSPGLEGGPARNDDSLHNERPATVETVYMPEESRQTICISTQAGCAVDCHFCLTATLGLIRNLSPGEILGQVLVALEDNRAGLKPQTNVVLMGQGEPLLNYDPVITALRVLLDSEGLGISPKHVTLSTSGIIPGIDRLARERVRPKLAVSLNASNDEQRDQIMPINRKYPIGDLISACHRYPLRPWEHLTFEYVLLGGFNDAAEDARRVAKLLANLRVKVNLIPWNPGDLPYKAPEAARVEEFRQILTEKGLLAFVRYSRGQDVMAACGQLALLEGSGQRPLAQISR